MLLTTLIRLFTCKSTHIFRNAQHSPFFLFIINYRGDFSDRIGPSIIARNSWRRILTNFGLTFFAFYAKESPSVRALPTSRNGSDYPRGCHLWSLWRSEIVWEGARHYHRACDLTQMCLWFAANCTVVCGKWQSDLPQTSMPQKAKTILIRINSLLSAS